MKGNLIIVSSDKTFVEGFKYNLEQEKYRVEEVSEFERLLDRLKKSNYEMIVLDMEYPDLTKLNLIKDVREISKDPLIITSNSNDDMIKILSLDYGGDDFLEKPINMQELKARIKAILRREKYKKISIDNHIFRCKNIVINSLRRKVSIENVEIDLTGKEFDLFYVLFTEKGRVFTREELLEKVWGYAYYGDIRTVDVHIRRVREKIEQKLSDSQYIMTKWGEGYYFNNI